MKKKIKDKYFGLFQRQCLEFEKKSLKLDSYNINNFNQSVCLKPLS